MKKTQVDAILVDQAIRRKNIIIRTIIIVAIFLLSLTLLLMFFERNKNYYVSYNENGKIDYKVYLKDNDFFENNYLGTNNQYIASLIDYIDATFNYKLSMDEADVSYGYKYRIEIVVDVKEKGSTNSLYNFSEEIYKSPEKTSHGDKYVTINENIKIDYNKYNDIIKKFVTTYQLEDIESTLTINMYVNAMGSCDDFSEDTNNQSVMTLTIPLTTKTVSIDISNDMINATDNILVCKKTYEGIYTFLFISIVCIVIDVLLLVNLISYEIRTRSAETIYEKELKKILNNYRSYIQKVNSSVDLKGYQALKVDSFNDILEIRDTIQQPILMIENEERNSVYFMVPSNTKILYMYRLKVSDIQKKMSK